MISVSKLCCPVCWKLLGLLNSEDEPPLSFPNYHSTVYPVELPLWLPAHIVEKLTKEFQDRLREELCTMLGAQEVKQR